MPPIRSRSSQNSIEQEGRILLAIQEFQNQKISSIREAARCFKVPEATLRRRLSGVQNRATSRANSHKLTEIEEESLQKWILSMDSRGSAPRPSMVREMANLLIQKRGTTPLLSVGEKWVYNFVKRRPLLSSRFSKRYNYERAKCEDPKIIKEWFDLVEKTILQFGIDPDDVYNFNETGFAMGLTATTRVISRSEYYGRRALLQPGNREWVTVIKCTNAAGWALPPCVIFKGKVFIESWFDGLPEDWRFEVSPNGWTSDEIGLRWLKKLFIPTTSSRTKGGYRLLILDGHGSHLTPKFDEICEENKIIPICMPPHSSHLLQPLDIGCFAVLKRSYGRMVEMKMRCGSNHIDKLDFLKAYPTARMEAFKSETVKNSFQSAGLIPFAPERVISKLNIRLTTPTPPPSRGSDWDPKTPSNYIQLQKQASSIKALLRTRSRSPPSPLNSAINQVLKACQITMQSAALLEKEVSDLRAENEKKKQKRTRSTRTIVHEGDLSVQDVRELRSEPFEAQVARINNYREQVSEGLKPPPQAGRACGICRKPGHRRETCPDR
ncbi:Pc06g01990 [Penicillium rubens Wisconsin 54-1255]|uniref:Pc06g01990 protein n=1 Tax=Penicillium rubens (strain ATCC 28089 / DSM 1075 / NRRL 1951 / Wisconsin 54-1255) TaxID=500485 RepID=B6GWA0_PENRW|nr:Pc06g01990 [Penicillium rubens Wisconsin 54-1255]